MSSPFVTPRVHLAPTITTDIRTLPDLVNFHVKNNPQHLFCLQAEKKSTGSGYDLTPVTYEKLHRALIRCQTWLRNHAPGFHSPSTTGGTDGVAVKSAPIAILMESDVGLAVYVLALMGLGIPAVLLSSRLSPLAVQHLIRTTGAKLTVVSPRLHHLILEAFPAAGDEGQDDAPDGVEPQDVERAPEVRITPGYGFFMEEERQVTAVTDAASITHPLHYIAEDDRQVVILHSSGSSGLPKPIYCSHRYFLGFSVCHGFVSDAEAQGLTISTSPFFHVRSPSLTHLRGSH